MSKTTRRPLHRRKAEIESQQDLDDAGWDNKLSDLLPWLKGTDMGNARLVRDDRDKEASGFEPRGPDSD